MLQFGTSYDQNTGLNTSMKQLMSDPNHNRPSIKQSILKIRNYKTGLGRRDLTWSLLFTVAQKNWHLALTTMQEMVNNGGTWKDPRDFALFCHKYGYTALHTELMTMYVKQLLLDLTIYTNMNPDDNPRTKLSFAAKYAPRERSWLHPIVMDVWNRIHPECQRIGTASEAAARKCAMIYRQSVSKLNRAIETTEIAMCAGEWESIQPSKIPLQTQLKYRQCFEKRLSHKYSDAGLRKIMPLWLIVKYALTSKCDKWNDVWKMRTQYLKPTTYVVPCIKMDTTMFEQSNRHLLYKAISEALLLAKQSLFGEFVMVFSHLTLMIDVSKCVLSEAADKMCNVLFHEIEPCIHCGLQTVKTALTDAKFTEDDINKVKVVVITHTHVDPPNTLNAEIKYIY